MITDYEGNFFYELLLTFNLKGERKVMFIFKLYRYMHRKSGDVHFFDPVKFSFELNYGTKIVHQQKT